jgi:hypothetical protein
MTEALSSPHHFLAMINFIASIVHQAIPLFDYDFDL